MCCFLAALLGGGFLVRWWQSWRGRLPRRGRDLLAEIIAEPICRASTAT